MRENFVELRIKGIVLNPENGLPTVLLNNNELDHLLPVEIGPFEASAIIVEMEGLHPPRPLTHDLMSGLFFKHNFTVLRLEIYGMLEEKHLARIIYKHRLRQFSMEVRPSDGIAIVLRMGAPILVSENVLVICRENMNFAGLDFYAAEYLYLDGKEAGTQYM